MKSLKFQGINITYPIIWQTPLKQNIAGTVVIKAEVNLENLTLKV